MHEISEDADLTHSARVLANHNLTIRFQPSSTHTGLIDGH
jgi:hypothetical protein